MTTVAPPSITAVSVKNDPDYVPGQPPFVQLTITNNQPFNLIGIVDASFETGIGSAVSPIGIALLTSSTEQALDGTHSLKAHVIETTGTTMTVQLGPYPVLPLTEYTVMANFRAKEVNRTVTLALQYYDASMNLLSTSSASSGTSATTTWMSAPGLHQSPTTPAGTAFVVILLTWNVAPALISPVNLVVTPTGTAGSTDYGYVVTATDAIGEGLPCPFAITTTGNATLSGSNFNALTWNSVSGATGYGVYRGTNGTCADLFSVYMTCAELISDFSTCGDLFTKFFVNFKKIGAPGTNSLHDTGLTATTPVPTVNTSGESHYVDEVGLFDGAAAAWSIVAPGGIIISRQDGTYVQGASPLQPFLVAVAGVPFNINDYDAPYGLPVAYSAVLSSGPFASLPSPTAGPVLMGQAQDTCALYQRLGWAKSVDATGVLFQWIAGIGELLQTFDTLIQDQFAPSPSDLPPTLPGWSQAIDITRCPTYALPWLGQFVGARLPDSLRDDQMRYLIENAPGLNRGTVSAILAAANTYLLPGFSAVILERTLDAYTLTIDIPAAGVLGNGSCRSLYLQYATCADVLAAFATCADLWQTDAIILPTVLAAIPAGLVATINFV